MACHRIRDEVGAKVLIRIARILLAISCIFGWLIIGDDPSYAGTGTGGGRAVCVAGSAGVTCIAQRGGASGTSSAQAGPSGGIGTPPASPVVSVAPSCPHYVTYRSFFGVSGGPPPPGTSGPGTWFINTCASGNAQSMATGVIWFPLGQAPKATAMGSPPTAAAAGAKAASQLQLAPPVIALSPAGTGYVNLAEWLWIDNPWAPVTTTARACNSGGCTSASATAVPREVVWAMGDGHSVTCEGPGIPYRPGLPTSSRGACTYTYTRSSAGQPSPDGNPNDGMYDITATIHWAASWQGAGQKGTLPAITTASQAELRVGEIETVGR